MTEPLLCDSAAAGAAVLSINARFREIAARHADLEAVRSSRDALTYRELDARSLSLAGLLCRRLGAKPRPVALLLEDGTQVITGLLAAIRAGHFYSVLSQRDPEPRLAKILQDLEAPVLLTDSASLPLAERIAPPGCELVQMSAITETGAAMLPADPGPETALGVFYTSGSTGEPKGVLRTHAYVLHRLWVDVRDYGIGPGDRLLFMRPFNVSASLSSLFDALLTGATLVLYDAGSLGIRHLEDVLENERISVFVPPIEFLRSFLDSLDAGIHFHSIRIVVLGGDVLFRRDVERLRLHLPGNAQIAHHLSSSESGLLARTILRRGSPIPADIVPLGFPVAEKEILILDPDGKPLPDSVPGEIAVRSKVLFPGYWHQPEQSEARFRPDPADPSRRVYCTGDLGYFMPDGQLVFLGRKDLRAKIRGFSVDCASVECALLAVPEVLRAVVVPALDRAGHKRLAGYIVPAPGSAMTAAGLRSCLLGRIPAYMVPSIFVFLPELPLTPGMKVDRKALPTPDWSQASTSAAFVAPRNEVESQLAWIWQKVIGVEGVGIDDSFFDLGGDSLLAMILFVEIEQVLGVRLPLRTLLDHETIRQMAALIKGPRDADREIVVTFHRGGQGTPVFFIPYGSGDVLGLLRLASLLDKRQPIYGLQAAGMDGKNIYKLTVEEIAAQFIDAIRAVQPSGPYRLIGISFGGQVAYEMALRLLEAGETVELLGLIDTTPPGPLRKASWRIRLHVHRQNLRSLPKKRHLRYFRNQLRNYLVDLARQQPLQMWFTAKTLTAIVKDRDPLRVGHAAHALYAPRPYPGDVVIFRATLRDWYVAWDPMAGWRRYVKGALTMVDVAGDHGNIHREPYVLGLAEAIDRFLAKASTPR